LKQDILVSEPKDFTNSIAKDSNKGNLKKPKKENVNTGHWS